MWVQSPSSVRARRGGAQRELTNGARGQLRDMPEVGLMHRASLSLLSEGPGGQDLFPSPIYLEPSSTEEVGGA